MRTIYLANLSSKLSAADAEAAAGAVSYQAQYHFAPFWYGLTALVKNAALENIPNGAEVVYLIDDLGQAGVLGEHSVATGVLDYGVVDVSACLQYGDSPSSTISHEILEMIPDPLDNETIPAFFDGKFCSLAKESCDPTENFVYEINGVEVSDFVLPSWFVPNQTRVDFLGILKSSLTVGSGGYQAYTTDNGQTWNQVFGRKIPDHQKEPPLLSRRWRRFDRGVHGASNNPLYDSKKK